MPACAAGAKLLKLNSKIRVGAVSYFNTKPLLYGIEQRPFIDSIELVKDYPARIAEMLQKGEIDVGLIPVAIIPTLRSYHIACDYGIATDNEVASVCLFSEVPVEQVEKVFLDYQSRSSVALLKLLMSEYWGIHPQIIQAEDESYRDEIKGTTAGLVIGDRALEQRKISTFIYDLGQEWRKMTGLPFVFAAWVSVDPLPQDFLSAFNEANAKGLAHIDEIVAANPFDVYDLKKYYNIHISYHLDEKKKEGLERFLEYLEVVKSEQ